ncbi:MAG: FeoA family protein [Dorea formicigenerans]
MMPLTMLNPGESASIVRVGGNEETKRFLENLGFVAGSVVKVISSNEGNIIAQIKESRVAVSKGIANKIMV